jgi:hypothetical protein
MMIVLSLVDGDIFLKSGWLRGGISIILIADIFAGTVANFTRGTNNFYAKRPRNRWLFIGIHAQPLLIAWLLDGNLLKALFVWLFTLISASIVNMLVGKIYQREVAGTLMSLGIFIAMMLYQNESFIYLTMSVFFMIKVVYSFSVDHEMRRLND